MCTPERATTRCARTRARVSPASDDLRAGLLRRRNAGARPRPLPRQGFVDRAATPARQTRLDDARATRRICTSVARSSRADRRV